MTQVETLVRNDVAPVAHRDASTGPTSAEQPGDLHEIEPRAEIIVLRMDRGTAR